MEVTEEMIKAVDAYRAEQAKQRENEYWHKYRENVDRINRKGIEGVREVFPDVTEGQFRALVDVFADYYEEMWDR